MKRSRTLYINIDKKKGLLGIFLAAAVLILCIGGYSWKAGAVFALCFVGTGFLKINSESPAVRMLVQIGYIAVGAVAVCWLSQMLMDFNSFLDLGPHRMVMGILCVAVLMLILFMLTLDARIAVAIGGTLCMCLTTANHYVYEFQGNELTPLTFLSAGTAANVIGNYTFTFPAPMVYSWIIWILLAVGGMALSGVQIKHRLRSRGIALLISLLFLGLWCVGARGICAETWGRSGTIINGYLLNFTLELKSAYVQKPANYSDAAIEALEEAYGGSDGETTSGTKPDVIVIMDEAFADLRVLGSEIRTDREVTPFYDSLKENTIRGYALSSIYGGMTANSEFEFLTGMSMAFLPTASVPYQQYLTETQYSLVSVMKENGYTCFATHPFLASGWSRERVYANLGFDSYTFIEDYPQEDLVRDLVSDREMFGYLIERYEQQQGDENLFLFGITMQNHGGYAVDGYDADIHLEGYQNRYDEAEQYLSLLHKSDEALAEFITYFQSVEEEVIVVFFGDHLPDLPMGFYEEVHGGAIDTLDQQMLTYSVPFFIWANFDIPEQTLECTSLNYLAVHLLDTAGISLPPYYRFMADLETAVPAMNALGYYSKDTNSFMRYEDAIGVEADWINHYAALQYNNLFDKRNISLFFEDAITEEPAE